MFSSSGTPTGGEARRDADAPQSEAAGSEWPDEREWFDEREWIDADGDPVAAGRDGLDAVADVSTLMSVFAAQRFERVEGLRREAMAEAAVFRGKTTEIVMRSLRLELATVLQVTEHIAERMLATSDGLMNRYPAMLDALSHARTTERHADVFVELVDQVEPELRDQVVPLAVDLATTHALGSFRRLLRKLVDTVRAATLSDRHAEAVRERRVVVQPAEDGMSWVMLYTSAVKAHAIQHRATAIAHALGDQEGEERSLDELRADVLVDLLVDGDVPAHPDAARGIRAAVAVTVPVLSLLDDEHANTVPAVVEGVGPIPIEQARELCGGADGWMRVLTHPETGMVLSVGRDQYRTPAALRRLVEWRAATCMAPGCGTPARRCQIDHQLAWEHGGTTELTNLGPLCVGHHTIKHHGGWCVTQIPDSGGALEWLSPGGRRFVVRPERKVPVFRPAPDDDRSPEATVPF
ncbi:HNH endonuclease signature motif containing protein [Microbacterium sp. A1-JK]|uniref:HNH endonuclease signature motif containing protein n=1 Tax=Microbacterium sp. A1-JK TaxID=3177516 RepID=UPI003883AFAD